MNPTLPVLVEINGLTHTHHTGENGIFDLSLKIFPGEYILVTGRNGSGKTTLIRHFNGLLKPDHGHILLEGKDVSKHLSFARQRVGMVFQDPDVQIIGDTVFDEVAFGLENLKTPRSLINQKVNHILERMDLNHYRDQAPSDLSGGEKRRLAIAGILVMDPEIIIFDEPFANLDYPSTLALAALVRELNQKGRTIIMATHDVEPVIEHSSRIMILEKGRLEQDGPPLDLVSKLASHGVQPPWSARAHARQIPSGSKSVHEPVCLS